MIRTDFNLKKVPASFPSLKADRDDFTIEKIKGLIASIKDRLAKTPNQLEMQGILKKLEWSLEQNKNSADSDSISLDDELIDSIRKHNLRPIELRPTGERFMVPTRQNCKPKF